jgi:hypothetical protein
MKKTGELVWIFVILGFFIISFFGGLLLSYFLSDNFFQNQKTSQKYDSEYQEKEISEETSLIQCTEQRAFNFSERESFGSAFVFKNKLYLTDFGGFKVFDCKNWTQYNQSWFGLQMNPKPINHDGKIMGRDSFQKIYYFDENENKFKVFFSLSFFLPGKERKLNPAKITSLASYKNKLYVGTKWNNGENYFFEGSEKKILPNPCEKAEIEAMAVSEDKLYAFIKCFPESGIYTYDGNKWEELKKSANIPPDFLAVYKSKIFIGEKAVYENNEIKRVGREYNDFAFEPGYELFNDKIYFYGTHGNYSYFDGTSWTKSNTRADQLINYNNKLYAVYRNRIFVVEE